jgi:hypothetical protein
MRSPTLLIFFFSTFQPILPIINMKYRYIPSPAPLSILFFHALNALLVWLFPSAVPRRDLFLDAAGVVVLFILSYQRNKNTKQQDVVVLHKTTSFQRLFVILSLCEVLSTLLLPWFLIWRSDGTQQLHQQQQRRRVLGYILSPHLFVFQTQIGLESIILWRGNNDPKLLFDYTVVCNLYRSIAILQWISRSSSSSYTAISAVYLAYIAAILWVCSNAFIVFIWRPCLHHHHLHYQQQQQQPPAVHGKKKLK